MKIGNTEIVLAPTIMPGWLLIAPLALGVGAIGGFLSKPSVPTMSGMRF